MAIRWASESEKQEVVRVLNDYLADQLAQNSAVSLAEQVEEFRWMLRLKQECRDVSTIWFWLRDYTLWWECYFLPQPANAALYEHLLRWSGHLYSMRFSIGEEDAVYLFGQMPLNAVTAEELDRIVGSTYEAVERFFRPALRLGFARS